MNSNPSEFTSFENSAPSTISSQRSAEPTFERAVGLYDRAKQAPMIFDFDWSGVLDPLEFDAQQRRIRRVRSGRSDILESLDPELTIELTNWTLSQLLHGEQGALLCSAKLARCLPSIEGKQFAATQASDEARHCKMFAGYIEARQTVIHGPEHGFASMLGDAISDGRWDITCLGMQVLIEGMALSVFGLLRSTSGDHVFNRLLRVVSSDAARHQAFGVLALEPVYAGFSDAELRERQDFVAQALHDLKFRFNPHDLAGMDPKIAEVVPYWYGGALDPQALDRIICDRLLPACRRIGLLDACGGRLRDIVTSKILDTR